MKLIIAEKPSMARSIVAALESNHEKFANKGEYYESDEHYVTSQFGHLLELYMPEEYKGEFDGEYAPLPFFPKEYKFKIKENCKTRFDTIKDLINRADVDEIIHCGDADREGQLLIDLVLEKTGTTKKVTRPQIVALTPGSILSALATRKDNSEYHALRDEGYARMISDFDFGIYLSRYCKQKTGARKIHIGRVKGAILTEIYNRDKEIENFVSTPYFKVISDKDGIKLTAKAKFEAQEDAESLAKELQGRDTVVTEVKTNRIKKKKPKLFSQTTLQSYMSKRYGFDPSTTLQLTQYLYETAHAVTYPRTDSEYLLTSEKGVAERVLKAHDKTGELEMNYTKAVFDDSKVDSHSAIIPTDKVIDVSSLTLDQQKCYNAILNRFKAVFCKDDCEYDKTTIKAENGEEVFTLTGEVLVTKGWQKFEDYAMKDKAKKRTKDDENEEEDDEEKELPKLNEGDIISTDFKSIEKHTVPPKHYTVTTLGEWMKNPFKDESKDEENDDEDYKNILAGLQIGTTATRAIIIDTLVNMEYMELKKASYLIKDKGVFLVETSKELGIDFSKEKTAEMGKILKDITKGDISLEKVLEIEHGEIEDIINSNKSCKRMDTTIESVGTCPKCGKPVIQGKKGYGCSGWRDGCDFVVWMEIAHKKISKAQVQKLLKTGTTDEIKGFKNKDGKEFSAKLKINEEKNGAAFDFAKSERESLGKCPLCGKDIVEGQKAYGCSGWKDGCKFTVWKQICGKKIPAGQVKKLLASGKTDTIKGFKSKTGKEFSSALKLNKDKTGAEFDF